MAEKSSWDQANIRQKLGLVWRNRKKISQIFKDFFYLQFFLLIILWSSLYDMEGTVAWYIYFTISFHVGIYKSISIFLSEVCYNGRSFILLAHVKEFYKSTHSPNARNFITNILQIRILKNNYLCRILYLCLMSPHNSLILLCSFSIGHIFILYQL